MQDQAAWSLLRRDNHQLGGEADNRDNRSAALISSWQAMGIPSQEREKWNGYQAQQVPGCELSTNPVKRIASPELSAVEAVSRSS